ncbi:MAG TPA: methyltransferase [Pyrinomonadaceae bacterium]|jgi:protein-S-isoprenylcysteine O-methyltransferase Ste14
MQRWRVPLGFVCGAFFIVFARPEPRTLAVGGAVAVVGLLLRAWSAGHIRKNDRLAISGPYAHTRNPLYLGSFILGIGFTIAAASSAWLLLTLGALFASLFLGIYLPVMRVEATTLAKLFGDDYKRYAAAVPLFFPRLAPYRDATESATKFDASLYMRYREYRAALGLVVAWSVLALKPLLVGTGWPLLKAIFGK